MLHGYPLVKSLCGDLQARTLCFYTLYSAFSIFFSWHPLLPTPVLGSHEGLFGYELEPCVRKPQSLGSW